LNGISKVIQIGSLAKKSAWDNPSVNRVYNDQGVSPTLNTCGGGGQIAADCCV